MNNGSFYQYSFKEIENFLSEKELNPAGAKSLFFWHYRRARPHPCTEDLAFKTREYLNQNFDFALPEIEHVHTSSDGTVKFLFRLSDGKRIESVLIPFINKYSLCLSSQVGCAMNCSFCYTGTMGLTRHLTTSEIVGQFIQAKRWKEENLKDSPNILSIVFMGQGEPLHNFDAVKKASEIFLEPHGTTIAIQKITISTSGYLPGIKRWHEEMPKVNIALSLHSPFNEKRNQLIPINRRYPLSEVMDELDKIELKKKQFITFEYLLIKGFNDSSEDAHKTAELLKDRRSLINLIPFNPYPGSPYERPGDSTIENFVSVLESYKIPTMVRATKGDDILAACGQLNTLAEKKASRPEQLFDTIH